ncbi:MAG: DinB family protein [Candidatus Scalindua sp.]
MADDVVQALRVNFEAAFSMLEQTIDRFNPEQWFSEIANKQVPAQVAYHNIECIDFYFKENEDKFLFGKRFGKERLKGGLKLPGKEEMLNYLEAIDQRVVAILNAVSKDELQEHNEHKYPFGKSRLSHYIYALRHTMHHHGVLAALAGSMGAKKSVWK